MKKILSIFLCLLVFVSLCVTVFAVDAEVPVEPDVDTDFEFWVGTTGGGRWLTSASRCLLATILYISAEGYPSMYSIMQLENQVYDLVGDYTQWWLQVNGYRVLLDKATLIPSSIISFINYALRDLGSSIRVPVSTVALSQIDSFEELNNLKSRFYPFFLDKTLFDESQVSPGEQLILDATGNFNTYFQSTVDFMGRLDIAIFSEIQKSLNTIYPDVHFIQQSILNDIKPYKPVGSEVMEEVDEVEDVLINGAKASIHRGRDFMATGVDLLANYSGEFLFVVTLFEALYNIATIKTLCIVGFALGFFAFCINLVGDGASSLRGAYKSAKKASNSKKGG